MYKKTNFNEVSDGRIYDFKKTCNIKYKTNDNFVNKKKFLTDI